MLKQMEKEGEADEDIYDKMACWCETNDREKTKAIADAEAKIADLTSKIEELTGTSARLNTEIKNLHKDIEKDQQALDQADAMRQKELAEFNEEEKDAIEAISALKNAITVLSKHHTALQQRDVVATLQYQMDKHVELLAGVLTHKQQKTVAAFVQQQGSESYAPQSGEIFGILKQMKETFESNLADSQKEEGNSVKSFEELKASKEAEIAAAEDQVEKKTTELADTDEKLAMSKEDLEDTKVTMTADEEFLAMLKEKCAMMDSEWEQHQKTRQEEMEAVAKALEILNSDEAHDLFTKTFSFVQVGVSHKVQQAQASKLLQKMAQKLQSPRLSALAVQVRLDAFTKVKKAIDDMVAELLKEKADEIKHKDFCVEEFNTNKHENVAKEQEKKELVAKIEDLTLTIKTLTEEIDALKASIAEMQQQMKYAGEDREKENKEFQMTVADQRATQKILAAALNVLKGFYAKKEKGVELAQQQKQPAGPPPPEGFAKYKKGKGGGAIGMIEGIINEAKALEAEAIRAEDDAQKSYEDFVKETNASIEAASKEIVNKSEEKATAETDKTEAQKALDDVLLDLEQLENYNNQLHESCDYVLKNFDARQAARDGEIEALKQAKSILSGAKFDAFLQRR